MEIAELEALLIHAVDVEKRLKDNSRYRMDAHSGMPEHLYEAEDRKHWMDNFFTVHNPPTAKEISLLDRASEIIRSLGDKRDKRTVVGKRIIWQRSNGVSYRRIAWRVGVTPPTVKAWYEQDIAILAEKN